MPLPEEISRIGAALLSVSAEILIGKDAEILSKAYPVVVGRTKHRKSNLPCYLWMQRISLERTNVMILEQPAQLPGGMLRLGFE